MKARMESECSELNDTLLTNFRLIKRPLSVFIVSDLLESAQAHAAYRFCITDEETGEKRLLVSIYIVFGFGWS
jgi:hypothetical protein